MNKTMEKIGNKVDCLVTEKGMADSKWEQGCKDLEASKDTLNDHEEAQAIAQNIAREMQQQVHTRISVIVTRCLAAVFKDNPYEFAIDFDCKRGKTEARLLFLRDGMILDDPVEEVGGGVIDVAALALRLSCILLSRPRRRRLLVLDEPLKNVRGKQNRKNVRALLEALAEEMGLQIVLNVDGDSYPEFMLGTILEMS